MRGALAAFKGGFDLVGSEAWGSRAWGGFDQVQREGPVFQAEGLAFAKAQGRGDVCWRRCTGPARRAHRGRDWETAVYGHSGFYPGVLETVKPATGFS